MQTLSHHHCMSLALQLAERGRYSVSPNPMVGCVIVKNNQIIGQGFHQRAGEPHAEIFALHEAGLNANNATMYVNLEPCCHFGRTPPCTEALIQAGIKKIYVAALDPNPLVAGKGVATLRAAGIEVEIGLLEEQASQLNEIFFYYMKHQQPFVIAKWAMSLDGKMETHPVDDKKISGQTSHVSTHKLRQQVDAILIGSGTAIKDNPLLTVRLPNDILDKQPLRIILSSRGNLPLDLRVFDNVSKTMVATTTRSDKQWRENLLDKKIEVLILQQDDNGQVDLTDLLTVLGKRQITSLLIEGGKKVHESFFAANLINKVQVYVAPVIIGSLEKKRILEKISVMQSGEDVCFVGEW